MGKKDKRSQRRTMPETSDRDIEKNHEDIESSLEVERNERGGNECLKRLEEYGKHFMSMFDSESSDTHNEIRNVRREIGNQQEQEGLCAGSDGEEVIDTLESDGEDEFESLFHQSGTKSRQQIMNHTRESKQRKPQSLRIESRNSIGSESNYEHFIQDKKRFMSSKASVISSEAAYSAKRSRSSNSVNASSELDGINKEDFLKMQREVHMYGANALDKKSRLAFHSTMLEKLGARREKAPRTPASIGVGMAKKRKKRESQALEEAIAAGMIERKGLGKKLRRKQNAERKLDRGLMEDGGAFRNGVLSLSQMKRKNPKSPGHRRR